MWMAREVKAMGSLAHRQQMATLSSVLPDDMYLQKQNEVSSYFSITLYTYK